jgi:hypothetical protein
VEISEIKAQLKLVAPIFEEVADPKLRAAIKILLNLFEILMDKYDQQVEVNRQLKDEINRLKGEQPRPKPRPDRKDKDHSSEKERKERESKKTKKKRTPKQGTIKADRIVVCTLDKKELPEDAVHKGHTSVVIQDIKVMTDNIKFERETYYSPSLNKTFMADLPAGYDGEFGPGIKTLVLSLYHNSNMTQPGILDFLQTTGVIISAATVSRILTDDHDVFHQEKEDIVDAGLQSAYQHIDDTTGRVDGKAHYVHILSNPLYTAFFTRARKDRLTLLEILCRGDLKFLFNQETSELMVAMGLPKTHINRLRHYKIDGLLNQAQIDQALLQMFPKPNTQKNNKRLITEAGAITYYRKLPHAIKHLMADDAKQFNYLADHRALCWIHEGRHYKKITPFFKRHRLCIKDFLTRFWDFYRDLLNYKNKPSEGLAIKLSNDFDTLFSTETGYDALDARIALTKDKKDALLLALKFPFLPLHNNDAEGGAQHQARLRDIHLQTKNKKGTEVKDTFATIVKTARKLKVNVMEYLHDRVTKKFVMPSLASLILKNQSPPFDSS